MASALITACLAAAAALNLVVCTHIIRLERDFSRVLQDDELAKHVEAITRKLKTFKIPVHPRVRLFYRLLQKSIAEYTGRHSQSFYTPHKYRGDDQENQPKKDVRFGNDDDSSTEVTDKNYSNYDDQGNQTKGNDNGPNKVKKAETSKVDQNHEKLRIRPDNEMNKNDMKVIGNIYISNIEAKRESVDYFYDLGVDKTGTNLEVDNKSILYKSKNIIRKLDYDNNIPNNAMLPNNYTENNVNNTVSEDHSTVNLSHQNMIQESKTNVNFSESFTNKLLFSKNISDTESVSEQANETLHHNTTKYANQTQIEIKNTLQSGNDKKLDKSLEELSETNNFSQNEKEVHKIINSTKNETVNNGTDHRYHKNYKTNKHDIRKKLVKKVKNSNGENKIYDEEAKQKNNATASGQLNNMVNLIDQDKGNQINDQKLMNTHNSTKLLKSDISQRNHKEQSNDKIHKNTEQLNIDDIKKAYAVAQDNTKMGFSR